MTYTTTPKPEDLTEVGATLGRINEAVFGTHHVTTDGHEYYPTTVVESLAAELGYEHQRVAVANPTMESVLGWWAPDEKMAQWHKRYRLATLLRVLGMAGADPDDVTKLAEAMSIEERDTDLGDNIDRLNEQTHLHWVQKAAMHYAVGLANAEERGREQVLADLQTLAGSGLLDQRDGDVRCLSPDISRHAEVVKKRPVTTLDNALATARDGKILAVAGLLKDVTKRTTRQGRDWVSAHLVDGSEIELLIFSDLYGRVARWLTDGAEAELTGRYDSFAGLPRLIVKTMTIGDVTASDEREDGTPAA